MLNPKTKLVYLFSIICFLLPLIALSQRLAQPWYITPRTGTQHIDLNGKWNLAYMDTSIADLKQLNNQKDAFETTIPNSVHWSLFKAGKLPHPYYNLNSVLYKWTDEKAWYYSRSFEIPVAILPSVPMEQGMMIMVSNFPEPEAKGAMKSMVP